MNVIHRLPPISAFQTRIFLEHSAENYASCLVVTFRSDPCALKLTKIRDWEILPSTTVCHISLETLMIIYIYTFLDYTWMKNEKFKTKFNIPFFFCSVYKSINCHTLRLIEETILSSFHISRTIFLVWTLRPLIDVCFLHLEVAVWRNYNRNKNHMCSMWKSNKRKMLFDVHYDFS